MLSSQNIYVLSITYILIFRSFVVFVMTVQLVPVHWTGVGRRDFFIVMTTKILVNPR